MKIIIDYNTYLVSYSVPAKYSSYATPDSVVDLDIENLNMIQKTVAELPKKVSGCTSSEITIKNIRITKKSGKTMPDAFNRNATKLGAFEDVFICETSEAWLSDDCPPVKD